MKIFYSLLQVMSIDLTQQLVQFNLIALHSYEQGQATHQKHTTFPHTNTQLQQSHSRLRIAFRKRHLCMQSSFYIKNKKEKEKQAFVMMLQQ